MSPLLREVVRAGQNDKALKIIAKSLFRELKEHGYDCRQIVSVSTELLGLVTSDLRNTDQSAVTQ